MMKFGKEWKKKDIIIKIRICASTNVCQSKTESEWFEVPDNLSEQELQDIALEEAFNGLCEIWWEQEDCEEEDEI